MLTIQRPMALAGAFLTLAIAAPAYAGKTVATPALRVPASGTARCTIVNASEKDIGLSYVLYEFDGTALFTSGPGLLLSAHASFGNAPVAANQASCIVTVESGSPKAIRVALHVYDSANNLVGVADGR